MFFSRTSFIGSALLLSGGLAMAADLPDPVYVEPAEYEEPVPLPPAGFYASLHAGYAMPGDVDGDIVFPVAPATVGVEIDVDDGYRFGGAIGYGFNSMIGIEAEVSYLEIDVDGLSSASLGGTAPTSGDAGVVTLMGNLILGQHYDRWRPYAGIGAGAAHIDLDVTIPALPNNLEDSDWAFAAQGFVGLDYALTDALSLGARYRYLHVSSTDYADGAGDPVDLDSFGIHSIEAAMKVRFGG